MQLDEPGSTPADDTGAARTAAAATSSVRPAALTARRVLAGADDRRASLLLEVVSLSDAPQRVGCYDEMPGWLPLRWHTLRAWITPRGAGEAEGLGRGAEAEAEAPERVLDWLRLTPSGGDAGARGGAPLPHHLLEWEVLLPPRATLILSIGFVKPLRQIDSSPADASRGLDVPPAALCVQRAGGRCEQLVHTNAQLVPLPIADNSILFNVLAISSTVVALFSGSMFNVLGRPPVRPRRRARASQAGVVRHDTASSI